MEIIIENILVLFILLWFYKISKNESNRGRMNLFPNNLKTYG